MNWIVENKEWLFSGIAIAMPLALAGWYLTKRKSKQVQKGGKNSTNIQVGGNFNYKSGNNDD